MRAIHTLLFKEFAGQVPNWPPRPSWFNRSPVAYCQTLVENLNPGDPAAHTRRFKQLLERAGFPHPGAHEFNHLHQDDLRIAEFIESAMEGLSLPTGDAPIIITKLNMKTDEEKIRKLLTTPVRVNGVVNVRILVPSEGILEAQRLISDIHDSAWWNHGELGKKAVPNWWPIFQCLFTPYRDQIFQCTVTTRKQWIDFYGCMELQHLCLTVNPWTMEREMRKYIKSVQVPIGHPDNIRDDGWILLDPIKVTGAPDTNASYNLLEYLARCPPVIKIIVGPSPGWSDDVNLRRIEKVTNLLHRAGVV